MIFYSDRVHGALMWMVGGLAARSWPHVNIILPYAVIGLILALASAAYLNILQLGDEMARGLGVNVEVTRIIPTAIAALLAASAVSGCRPAGLCRPCGAACGATADRQRLPLSAACLRTFWALPLLRSVIPLRV
mgnify:CR=1 FL=1